eukprot:scaffold97944_cov16-Tisochrysis_lutea.AAC.1
MVPSPHAMTALQNSGCTILSGLLESNVSDDPITTCDESLKGSLQFFPFRNQHANFYVWDGREHLWLCGQLETPNIILLGMAGSIRGS